jgi:hypothetical protein
MNVMVLFSSQAGRTTAAASCEAHAYVFEHCFAVTLIERQRQATGQTSVLWYVFAVQSMQLQG